MPLLGQGKAQNTANVMKSRKHIHLTTYDRKTTEQKRDYSKLISVTT